MENNRKIEDGFKMEMDDGLLRVLCMFSVHVLPYGVQGGTIAYDVTIFDDTAVYS